MGGRVLDVELGKIENPSRYSGGFRNPVESKDDLLVGCHCDDGDVCEKFNVEVGAGWMSGLKGFKGKARMGIEEMARTSRADSPYSPLCKKNIIEKTKPPKKTKTTPPKKTKPTPPKKTKT